MCVDVDGGQATAASSTGPMHFPTWLPPDGKDIVYRLESAANPGIYAIARRWQQRATAAVDDPCQQRIRLPGDRRLAGRFAHHLHAVVRRGSPAGVRAERRHRRGDPAPDVRAGVGQRGTATYSPDGALVAYARIFSRRRLPARRRQRRRVRQRANDRPEEARSAGRDRGACLVGVHARRHGADGPLRTTTPRARPTSCRSMDRRRPTSVRAGSSSSTSSAWHPDGPRYRHAGRPALPGGRPCHVRRRLQSGHGPPCDPDPRRRHRSGAGGGDVPRPRGDRDRVRMGARRGRRGGDRRARHAAP